MICQSYLCCCENQTNLLTANIRFKMVGLKIRYLQKCKTKIMQLVYSLHTIKFVLYRKIFVSKLHYLIVLFTYSLSSDYYAVAGVTGKCSSSKNRRLVMFPWLVSELGKSLFSVILCYYVANAG